MGTGRFELPTSALSARCSTTELCSHMGGVSRSEVVSATQVIDLLQIDLRLGQESLPNSSLPNLPYRNWQQFGDSLSSEDDNGQGGI